jgi:hypothetical protein
MHRRESLTVGNVPVNQSFTNMEQGIENSTINIVEFDPIEEKSRSKQQSASSKNTATMALLSSARLRPRPFSPQIEPITVIRENKASLE